MRCSARVRRCGVSDLRDDRESTFAYTLLAIAWGIVAGCMLTLGAVALF